MRVSLPVTVYRTPSSLGYLLYATVLLVNTSFLWLSFLTKDSTTIEKLACYCCSSLLPNASLLSCLSQFWPSSHRRDCVLFWSQFDHLQCLLAWMFLRPLAGRVSVWKRWQWCDSSQVHYCLSLLPPSSSWWFCSRTSRISLLEFGSVNSDLQLDGGSERVCSVFCVRVLQEVCFFSCVAK